MKTFFEPGSFILVPNKNRLDEISANSQVLWLWLCAFANEDGECYPSRSLLAKKMNRTPKTVDKSLSELEEKGWLKKKHQVFEGQYTSNLYQLFLLDKKPPQKTKRAKLPEQATA